MWGMISLGDRVKDTSRGGRKDKGKIVRLGVNDDSATIRYDDGEEVTVNQDKARKW